MTQNIGTRTSTPLGILDVNYYTDFGTVYSGWKYGKMIKVGEIEVGTDKDSDIIAMPGKFSHSFYINESLSTCLAILSDLKNVEIMCVVYINSNPIWLGFVDPESLDFDTDKKTFTLKAYDPVRKLLDLKPTLNPLGYTLTDYKKITDIVSEAFSYVTWFYSNGVISKSTIEAYHFPTYYNFIYLYTKLSYFYGSQCGYNNIPVMLKQLLLNFNLLLFPFLDRSIYLIPRFPEYDSAGYYQITRNDYIENPQYDIASPINNLSAKLWVGGFPKDDPQYRRSVGYSFYRTVNITEELIIDLPGGEVPGFEFPTFFSGVYVNNGSYVEVDPTTENYRRRFTNGSYSNLFYLWKYPVDGTWDKVNYPRKKCSVKVKGNFNNWKPDRFYTLQDINIVWRPAQFKFDLLHNTTEIKLREA